MSEPAVETVRGIFDAWNTGDLDAVGAFLAPDVQWREVGGRLDRPQTTGRESLQAGLGSLFETWSTYRLEPEEIRAVGDRVIAVVREVARGRTSGLEVESRWGYVIAVSDGVITQVQAYRDPREALAAVGLEA